MLEVQNVWCIISLEFLNPFWQRVSYSHTRDTFAILYSNIQLGIKKGFDETLASWQAFQHEVKVLQSCAQDLFQGVYWSQSVNKQTFCSDIKNKQTNKQRLYKQTFRPDSKNIQFNGKGSWSDVCTGLTSILIHFQGYHINFINLNWNF